MTQLQHDTAIEILREVMAELRDAVPYKQRLMVLHRLYCCVRAGLLEYESAQHAERRLQTDKN